MNPYKIIIAVFYLIPIPFVVHYFPAIVFGIFISGLMAGLIWLAIKSGEWDRQHHR